MTINLPSSGSRRAAFGVAQWFQFGDYAAAERQIAALERLRIQHLRCGVSWADYCRDGGEQWYDWLIRALARRAALLPCVAYTPPSIAIKPATSAPPRHPKAYADFLDSFITRYGIYFDAIELWNEPNNLLDWDWRLDPDWRIFSNMIGKAAYWVRRRGKTAVLGGMCPVDLNWLRMMAERGVLDSIDVIGIHGFPGTWSADFPGWDAEVGRVRDALNAFHWQGDIWITECGYSTWRHDEPQQVAALQAALDAPAGRVYWYSLADLDAHLPSQEGHHFDERHYHTGLVRADGSNKLAARLIEQGGLGALDAFSSAVAKPYLKPVRAPVVITGGCGFIGVNLADALAERGEHVLLFDNFSRAGAEENAAWIRKRHPVLAECAPGDLRDTYLMRDVVKGARAVLHLAAQTAVTSSLHEPAEDFAVNAAGTLHVLEAVRRHAPEAPVLFASTNKVYGKLLHEDEIVRGDDDCAPADPRLHGGIDESAPLDFYSPYGCSKGAADQYVRDYARVFGLRAAVLRMSCIYGRRQFGNEDQGWLAHFLIRAIRGQEITIYGDGRQVRDVLYVDDAVDAWLGVLAAIDRCRGRIFNLGGGPKNAISLLQAIDMIGRRRGLRPQLRFAPARPGDQDWYVSNTGALHAAIQWTPRTKVAEGLRRLELWLEERFGNNAPSGIPEEARV